MARQCTILGLAVCIAVVFWRSLRKCMVQGKHSGEGFGPGHTKARWLMYILDLSTSSIAEDSSVVAACAVPPVTDITSCM